MVNVEIINELWLQIDKLHLSYLQTDESPERIEQKRKLEGFMKEYLSLVTANQRFYSTTTKAVLYSSILQKGDHFSPGKFGHAWEMLGTYAANLLKQPWRKEFKEIRLYSGAYKYQIEQQLTGAEEILMEMGYTLDIEFNRLIIHPTVILDYDRIVTCHRDCLLAQVESLIMSEIHSALRVNLRPCSWAAIFDYRDSYVGSVPHCVRGLMYQQAQKESQQMAYACTTPAAAPTMSNPYALGPHEIYPTSYHHPYHQYHHSHHHHQQQQHQQPMRPVYAYSYQAEHQPHHRGTAMAAYLPKTLPGIEMPANAALPSLDAKSNFREEPKSRPVPEPFEVWNNNGAPVMKSVPKFDSLLDIDRLEQLCYDEVDTRQSQAETTKQAQRSPNSNKETTSNASKASTASSGTVQDKSSRATTSSTSAVKTLVKSFSATGARPKENIHPPSNGTTAKDAPDRSKVQRNGWECVFCTYLNSSGKEICDMCAKSRNRGPESQPLHRGGRECSNCTLVNPPDEEKCAACSTSLIHAPTYI